MHFRVLCGAKFLLLSNLTRKMHQQTGLMYSSGHQIHHMHHKLTECQLSNLYNANNAFQERLGFFLILNNHPVSLSKIANVCYPPHMTALLS